MSSSGKILLKCSLWKNADCNISRVRHVVVLPKQLPTWSRIREAGAMGLWCVTRCASFRFAGRSSKTPLKALTAPWVALTQQHRDWKFNFSQTSFPFYPSPVRILLSCTLSLQYSHLVDFLPDGNSFPPGPLFLNAETIQYTVQTLLPAQTTHLRVSEQMLVPVVSLAIIPPVLNADNNTSISTFTSTNTSTNTNRSTSTNTISNTNTSIISSNLSISRISSV